MPKLNRRRTAVAVLLIAILLLVESMPWARRPLFPFIRASARLETSLNDWRRAGQSLLERIIIGQETAVRLADLESRLASLSLERVELARLREENDDLRRLLDFTGARHIKAITTHVIGLDPRSLSQLRLAAGSQSGVRPGAAVISPNGALVGLIADTGAEVSVVRLLEHRLTQIPVRVLDREQAFGLLESGGGLSLLMTQIPKEAEIQMEDVVVTSLLRENVPPNIPIGIIINLKNDPQGLWQEAAVAPLVEAATLDSVAIVTEL